ncbi:hypothetical protein BIW11_04622 [Tropilaelaps mercedesae]|uniref:Uncharacterized protein n=1 Tax=Tropilaelaps mercedesae TaxID=418985 RepID=A0A1V9X3P9_9ACAR|nr:hypothetical protein BIW11_04622 [Tropilaelaps mercedesae]
MTPLTAGERKIACVACELRLANFQRHQASPSHLATSKHDDPPPRFELKFSRHIRPPTHFAVPVRLLRGTSLCAVRAVDNALRGGCRLLSSALGRRAATPRPRQRRQLDSDSHLFDGRTAISQRYRYDNIATSPSDYT